jgi:hypothetical protein
MSRLSETEANLDEHSVLTTDDFISISILEGKSKGGKLERESGKSQLDSGQAAI